MNSGPRHLFLSPHMDDAVLSACDLVLNLVEDNKKVLVVTIFTEFGKEPVTTSCRRYLYTSGFLSLKNFSIQRKKEDVSAMREMGVDFVHLGFTDAVFRKSEKATRTGNILALLGKGPRFIYPSMDSVLSGIISSRDSGLLNEIRSKLTDLIEPEDVLYSPLAVGNNVDHKITRNVILDFPNNKYFWEDQPYILWDSAQQQLETLGGEIKREFTVRKTGNKEKIFKLYDSQIKCLYKKGLTFNEEGYYTFSNTT